MFGKPKPDQWEVAYRELIAELETKERTWTRLEDSLRRAATQLGIAAMGQSSALDDALEPVLQFVRTGSGDPAQQLAALGDTLKHAERLRRRPAPADDAHDSERKLPTGPRGSADAPPEQRRHDDGQAPLPPATPAPGETDAEALQHVDIAVIVDALTARLARIREFEEMAEQFARRSRDGRDDDWHATLNTLADGIAQVVSSLSAERSELEGFVETMTSQLSQFEIWTQWHLSDAQSRQRESADLEATVNRQMQGLHEDMESSFDLTDLKRTVQRRLQSVAERFRAFRESEAERYGESERRNRELAEEVGRLQQRTTALSRICGNQQSRLMYDALTRVHSRYAYEQRLTEEFARWQRHGEPLAFTLWDIDRFKSINDTYGHDAGDRLLRRIGRIIQAHKRSEDFVARIGGEEFALLLPNTDARTAAVLADRLREVIGGTPFHYRGTPQHVTISCGVTDFRQGDTPAAVYKRADEALYEAKRGGRNRCVES